MEGIVLNFRDSRVLLSRLFVCNQERSFILPVRGWTRRNRVTSNCTSDWDTLWKGREMGELWLLSNYRRKRKLQPSDLYKNVTKNNIKTNLQLCFHAMMALNENNNLLLSWSWKENIKEGTAWKLNTTAAAIKRNNKSRLPIQEKSWSKRYILGCASQRLAQAQDTLLKNNIDINLLTTPAKSALVKGRGKQRNVMLVGTSNSGKIFLLKPLKIIVSCFVTPAKGTINWVGAENSQCVFLNDFRWSTKVIPGYVWRGNPFRKRGSPFRCSLRREAYVNKGYTNLWNIKNKNTKIRVLTSGWSGNRDVRQSVEEFRISLQVWCEHKNRLGTLSQVFCETYPLGWKLFFRKTIETVFWKVLKTVVSTQNQTDIFLKQANES